MARIAVIGKNDSIYGFTALGLETFSVPTKDEAFKLVKNLLSDDVDVIYLTEEMLAGNEEALRKLTDGTMKAIIPIPGVSGNTGAGMKNVRDSVIRAVGSDILFS